MYRGIDRNTLDFILAKSLRANPNQDDFGEFNRKRFLSQIFTWILHRNPENVNTRAQLLYIAHIEAGQELSKEKYNYVNRWQKSTKTKLKLFLYFFIQPL